MKPFERITLPLRVVHTGERWQVVDAPGLLVADCGTDTDARPLAVRIAAMPRLIAALEQIRDAETLSPAMDSLQRIAAEVLASIVRAANASEPAPCAAIAPEQLADAARVLSLRGAFCPPSGADLEALRQEEPLFDLQWPETDGTQRALPLSELCYTNRDDAELCAQLQRAKRGEYFTIGGGAAPIFTFHRVR